LTGAQAYATGRLISAVLCNNDESEKQALLAGKKSGDLVHPLPYAPDLHFSDLKSQIADMKNSNLGNMEGPPSSIAGLFIASHVDFPTDINWTHVDIACCAFAVSSNLNILVLILRLERSQYCVRTDLDLCSFVQAY
jgi:probable aminopeptidase NPEPL1